MDGENLGIGLTLCTDLIFQRPEGVVLGVDRIETDVEENVVFCPNESLGLFTQGVELRCGPPVPDSHIH